MRAEQDAMMLVRAELSARLESLQALSTKLSTCAFAENVDGIKTLAAAYGLTPVVRVAQALERTVYESGRARTCPTALYLQRLRDAIGCGPLDEKATQALVASVTIHLGG